LVTKQTTEIIYIESFLLSVGQLFPFGWDTDAKPQKKTQEVKSKTRARQNIQGSNNDKIETKARQGKIKQNKARQD
jgi:hypothetical protein